AIEGSAHEIDARAVSGASGSRTPGPGTVSGATLANGAGPRALERPRVRLGVQLDAVGAHRRGPADTIGLRIDEQADADAARSQRVDDVAEPIGVGPGLPARLAGDFSGEHRHE